MKIAILGTRGIPARYGGFETFAEELGAGLAERGHEVAVYARRSFGENSVKPFLYRGVQVITLPAVKHKYFETPLHSACTLVDALCFRKFDVLLLCNGANSPFAFLAKIFGVPIAINVDGIERQRAKWNALGKFWYAFGERCSVWWADALIADAEVIGGYYSERYGAICDILAYGARAVHLPVGPVHEKFGLKSGKYLLYVARLEPENHALEVVEAYRKIETELPLVIVGDAPYAHEYIAAVKRAADRRVIFAGFQFGEAYQELRSHCYLSIHAGDVGGTHPALLEAMAWGNCVIANAVSEHQEVLADCGIYYRKNNIEDLANQLRMAISNPEQCRHFGMLAKARAEERYSWQSVVRGYEALFEKMSKVGSERNKKA